MHQLVPLVHVLAAAYASADANCTIDYTKSIFFPSPANRINQGGPTLRVASEPSVYKPLARAVTATMWPENSPARELAVSLISLITVLPRNHANSCSLSFDALASFSFPHFRRKFLYDQEVWPRIFQIFGRFSAMVFCANKLWT